MKYYPRYDQVMHNVTLGSSQENSEYDQGIQLLYTEYSIFKQVKKINDTRHTFDLEMDSFS